MQGVRVSHGTPGELRRSQNWLGSPGCTLNNASYESPPPEFLVDCLKQFEVFMHDHNLPALIHVGICHYQFEAIHPFFDGNGRIGRLLISLLLIERKVLSQPLLYLSAFFESSRDEYYRQLSSVICKGTWHDRLLDYLSGVAFQAEDALNRAAQMNAIIHAWKAQVESYSSPVPASIIDQLAINPYITTKKWLNF